MLALWLELVRLHHFSFLNSVCWLSWKILGILSRLCACCRRIL